jgi:hypothetical protein
MQAHKFKFLASEFIALLDTGKFDHIGLDAIKRHITDGTISTFLIEHFGNDADFSVLDDRDWPVLTGEWQGFVKAADEQRTGIRYKGLCLLLGYAMRSQQNREAERKVA